MNVAFCRVANSWRGGVLAARHRDELHAQRRGNVRLLHRPDPARHGAEAQAERVDQRLAQRDHRRALLLPQVHLEHGLGPAAVQVHAHRPLSARFLLALSWKNTTQVAAIIARLTMALT